MSVSKSKKTRSKKKYGIRRSGILHHGTLVTHTADSAIERDPVAMNYRKENQKSYERRQHLSEKCPSGGQGVGRKPAKDWAPDIALPVFLAPP